MIGYLAEPASSTDEAPRPAVLVGPDIFGVGPHALRRAAMLAELGYFAFVYDIYGQGKIAADQSEALALYETVRYDSALTRRRIRAGLNSLAAQPGVDASRIAAIGYCYGGTAVLELARDSAAVIGVASFHGLLGRLADADETDSILARIAVFTGANDPLADRKAVDGFITEMDSRNADWQLFVFGGARHAFTIDRGSSNALSAYHPEADRRSWAYMNLFLEELFNPAEARYGK